MYVNVLAQQDRFSLHCKAFQLFFCFRGRESELSCQFFRAREGPAFVPQHLLHLRAVVARFAHGKRLQHLFVETFMFRRVCVQDDASADSLDRRIIPHDEGIALLHHRRFFRTQLRITAAARVQGIPVQQNGLAQHLRRTVMQMQARPVQHAAFRIGQHLQFDVDHGSRRQAVLRRQHVAPDDVLLADTRQVHSRPLTRVSRFHHFAVHLQIAHLRGESFRIDRHFVARADAALRQRTGDDRAEALDRKHAVHGNAQQRRIVVLFRCFRDFLEDQSLQFVDALPCLGGYPHAGRVLEKAAFHRVPHV